MAVSRLALVLALLLAACGQNSGSDLAGTQWTLASLNGTRPIGNQPITLQFKQTELGGFSGCNSYSGQYQVHEGQIVFPMPPGIATILMACEPMSIMEQETTYHQALNNATNYQVVGDRLELMDAQGQRLLTFKRGS